MNVRLLSLIWCGFDRASSLICGNKLPARCNWGFYCRSYCLLNMFRTSLRPSSGAQEYYTVVAACGISCCGFQVAGLVWSWGLCARFAGCYGILQTGHITLLSSWWWAQWCPKHVEQAIRSAIKTSAASSWHFISTYYFTLSSFMYQIFVWRKFSSVSRLILLNPPPSIHT